MAAIVDGFFQSRLVVTTHLPCYTVSIWAKCEPCLRQNISARSLSFSLDEARPGGKVLSSSCGDRLQVVASTTTDERGLRPSVHDTTVRLFLTILADYPEVVLQLFFCIISICSLRASSAIDSTNNRSPPALIRSSPEYRNRIAWHPAHVQ